jgi:RNA polymerase sigma-70 factor (ECF subfamily)
MESDEQLLADWAAGNQRMGSRLFGRYADRIYRFFATKVRDEHDDLVQRTFLKCLEAAKRGDEIGDAAALLFTIARNELFDHLRRRMREDARFSPEVTSLEDTGESPSLVMARTEQHRLLLAGLRRMPLEEQLVLELYYWEELEMESVARVLGISKSAAINRVHRAREALRERLRKMEARAETVEQTITGLDTWAKSLKFHPIRR